MRRTVLKSKIHGARLTGVHLKYEGSIAVDRRLLEAANLLPFEKVHVVNEANGSRLETYVIEAPEGSGEVCLNGPAARLGYRGDTVILLSYAALDEKELATHRPLVVKLDEKNRIVGLPLRSQASR